MFQECISVTPITGQTADPVFPNINGERYRDDTSFVATLRMALHGRIPENEGVYLRVRSSNRSPDRYDEESAAYDISHGMNIAVDMLENDLTICYLELYDADKRTRVMDFIEKNFVSAFPGWLKMQKVTDLFRLSFKVLCFYNVEKHSTILIVERMNYAIWHVLQSGIVGYLPWYFNLKEGECNDLVELIFSMREKTPDKYIACLSKFAEQFDFRTRRIETQLKGFELIALRERMHGVENDLETIERDLHSHQNEIAYLLRQKFDLDIVYTGVQRKLAEGGDDSEIKDYFLANKNLVLETVSGTNLYFGAKGYIEYYDEEALAAALRNRSSFVYTNARNGISGDDMELLMTALFIDNTLKLRICGAYYIDLRGGCDGIGGHEYGADYEGYMPNPHIDRYSCLGNHRQVINECLGAHNYIGAIEQCVSSVKSINFNDAPVMREFMVKMYGSDKKFIELPDGTVASPKDAIQWLKTGTEE